MDLGQSAPGQQRAFPSPRSSSPSPSWCCLFVAVADAEPDDDTEMEERPEVDADPDAEIEPGVEAEEADLDLQPAHRAEALDVLAQIELRFGLVREALYIEKMEELALEEAMILQGAPSASRLCSLFHNTLPHTMHFRRPSRNDTPPSRAAGPT